MALWGTQPDLNYLRGEVSAVALKLELVEFDVTYSGGFIGDHPTVQSAIVLGRMSA